LPENNYFYLVQDSFGKWFDLEPSIDFYRMGQKIGLLREKLDEVEVNSDS